MFNVARFPGDVQRTLSMMIRVVLSQILLHPTAHQNMALRFGQKNAKSNHVNMPKYVSKFIKDYCCSSFGYPAVLQIPGCTVDHLAVENAELYAKLGSSVDERESNFEKLMEDVHQFGEIVFSKLQRSINDLRNYTLHTEEQLINGEHCAVGQFIRDEFKVQKSKPAEEPTVVRPLEEYQNVEEEIIYDDPQHFMSEYTEHNYM